MFTVFSYSREGGGFNDADARITSLAVFVPLFRLQNLSIYCAQMICQHVSNNTMLSRPNHKETSDRQIGCKKNTKTAF